VKSFAASVRGRFSKPAIVMVAGTYGLDKLTGADLKKELDRLVGGNGLRPFIYKVCLVTTPTRLHITHHLTLGL
jgi:hypothetical protein